MGSAHHRGGPRQRIYHLTPAQALLVGLSLCLVETVLADGQKILTRIASYDRAPVIVQAAATDLVQSYDDPDAVVLRTVTNGGARPQPRVRYVNRMNQAITVLQLHGELTVRNGSPRTVEAMQITTILFNAFQERMDSTAEFVKGPLPPFRTQQIEWSRTAPKEEVYELYVVVTKIRFADGEIWAPTEELVLSPVSRRPAASQ